jgi:hypothetical protein
MFPVVHGFSCTIPGRKVGNALPGEPFILDDGTEKRQFTFAGNVVDLHAFLTSDVKEKPSSTQRERVMSSQSRRRGTRLHWSPEPLRRRA